MLTFTSVKSQTVAHPTETKTAISFAVSIPVKDMPILQKEQEKKQKAEKGERNKELRERSYPFYDPLPNGIDPALQRNYSNAKATPIIDHNFDGRTSASFPPDCSGSIGPNYFFEAYNTSFAIYNRTTEALVAGPTAFNTLFSGVTGSSDNDGDPIILYDEQADRWLAAEFALDVSGNDYMLIAVSTTNNPTGTWYKWSFDVADMPDYMKFGIWQDGYYMATNTSSGNDVYVFERSVMLAGGASPKMVGFDNPNRPTTQDGFHCIMPLDNDGDFAPAGTPGQFMTIVDGAISGGSDQIWVYELDVDWTTTSNSTFTRTAQINTPAFDSNFGNNWDNIGQPGTTVELDAIPQIFMYRTQYRNFGTSQAVVACHTVDVDGTDRAGVRWYELQNTGSGWSIRQNGTYSPDASDRWLGSISMNGNHEIGLAYSISGASSSIYPGIRFTGQTASSNALANGSFDVTETVAINGGTYQGSYNRWGDYAQMSIDPADDNTFWFNSEYMQSSTSTKGTRILAFRFQESNDPINLTATTISSDEIDLTWALNSTNDNVLLAWSPTSTFGTPANGTIYTAGQTIPGGGTVLSYNTNTSFNHTGLTENTTYYYKAWSKLSTNTYSPGVTANATTLVGPISTFPFTWDFEASADYTTDFTPWTTYDGNNTATYSSSDADFTGEGTAFAWMAMNPVASGWTAAQSDNAHGGSRCGMSICPSNASTTAHWFISPQLQLSTGSSFSLWTLTPKDTYGLESYQILVSTTDNNPTSFTALSGTVSAPATWTQHTYDLSAYDNQTIYIAIKYVSTDIFMMWIDDLEIVSNSCSSPLITSAPTASTVCSGSNASFSVTATGDAPITYQWKLNGTNITGATSSTLNLTSVDNLDAGTYTCYIANSCGNITTTGVTLTVNATTAITTQPVGNTYCEGSNISLSLVATGSGLTYQWKRNGTNVTGATSATYSVTASTLNAGTYTCVVTGACGSVTSNSANIVVNANTTITQQPVSANLCDGGSINLSVTATGTNVTYQWKLNGSNITGATSATYSATASTSTSGTYTCVVSGTCGSVTSNSATITVGSGITISNQPVGNTYCTGDNISLSVTASGTNLNYQWQLNGSNITGATSATYTTTASTSNAGNYTCVITGDCGSETTSTAVVTVNEGTTITQQPQSESICEGNNITFSIITSGVGDTYQWQFNGSNIAGATQAFYSINGISASNAGNYTCVITSSCGNITSNVAVLTINTTPTITTQPVSIDANEGDNVSFTVVVSGTGLSYQWNKNGANLSNGGNISGVNTNILSVSNVTQADYGNYDCDINGTCGNATTNIAILTVLTSIDALSNYGINISPNPSNGTFIIKVAKTNAPILINVVDVNGKTVFNRQFENSSSNTIDLSDKAKGVYFITLNIEKNIIKAKLIFK